MRITIYAVLQLVSLLLLIAGLSVTAQMEHPDQTTVMIHNIEEGQTIVGTEVHVGLMVHAMRAFTIEAADGTRKPNVGHYVLFFDRAPEFDPAAPLPQEPGIVHTALSSYTFANVPLGKHTLTALLVDGAHFSFDPPIMTTVRFTTVPASTPPCRERSDPFVLMSLAVAAVAVLIALLK